ncbi:MAG TPA: SHOCT domain-containing protein [Solirubrobacterales bacterium]|nr:SHOCT domain-containing protein [Solirubrobacterales bacterium]
MPLPIADISFGELLLIALEVFFFVIWIWILITILSDLFRDHELSGWGKAAWVFFLVFIPFLTALIYLIARGSGMRDRTIKAQADAKKHFDEYVREQAHAGSPADELHKLSELKAKGDLSDAEFEQAKAKLLA